MADGSGLPRIAVVQLGPRMHYAVPNILHAHQMLSTVFLENYLEPRGLWRSIVLRAAKIWPQSGFARWMSRADDRLDHASIVNFVGWHLMVAGMRKLLPSAWCNEHLERWWASKFPRLCAARLPASVEAVYGFQSTSLECFRQAKGVGASCILEQNNIPYQVQADILAPEFERWQGWTSAPLANHSFQWRIDRQNAELDLADLIIGGSDFVVDSLVSCGQDARKCVSVPYGVDIEQYDRADRADRAVRSRLRVLFVGEVGLRKGVPYLIEAIRLLGTRQIEFRFAGGVRLQERIIRDCPSSVAFLEHVPHERMREQWDWADVLVLPSLCEGSARVTYEAIASGIPVICTPNTGSLVEDGGTGAIIPIRSPEAIARAIERYASDRILLREHQARAYQNREIVSLATYERRLIAALQTLRPETDASVVQARPHRG